MPSGRRAGAVALDRGAAATLGNQTWAAEAAAHCSGLPAVAISSPHLFCSFSTSFALRPQITTSWQSAPMCCGRGSAVQRGRKLGQHGKLRPAAGQGCAVHAGGSRQSATSPTLLQLAPTQPCNQARGPLWHSRSRRSAARQCHHAHLRHAIHCLLHRPHALAAAHQQHGRLLNVHAQGPAKQQGLIKRGRTKDQKQSSGG